MEQGEAAAGRPAVEVRRSARRRRTVSAYREHGVTIVLIPARMSRAEERRWVDVMLRRLDRQDSRLRPSDDALLQRARELSDRHLDGRAQPRSVRWVTNQGARWGSCTPADGSIRVSHRLRGVPTWVLDYVLLHELVHLLVVDHSPEFWALVARFPRAERARGYLEGVAAAGRLGLTADDRSGAVEDEDTDACADAPSGADDRSGAVEDEDTDACADAPSRAGDSDAGGRPGAGAPTGAPLTGGLW